MVAVAAAIIIIIIIIIPRCSRRSEILDTYSSFIDDYAGQQEYWQ